MQILVDADACPVKHIIVRLAKQHKISVTMLIDTSHVLDDGYSTVITVDKEADSVDFALMGLLSCEDNVNEFEIYEKPVLLSFVQAFRVFFEFLRNKIV